jgi:Uma2 family endonuclease
MSEAALLPRPLAREETRHAITMDELLAMQAAGAFQGVRTQLLDGEIHIMPSDGLRHIHWAMEIAAVFIQALKPRGYFIGVQTTLHLSRWNGPSPDIYVLDAGPLEKETNPARIRLVIEVADTSLKDDLRDAAARYARHDIGEYWVVDVANQITHVHRAPKDGAYTSVSQVAFSDTVAPQSLPLAPLTLAKLAQET